ncbi:MAG: peptidoglycan-binding protein [Candidatus Sericytochromatia bacterium]|nr:peptidoglycan-binding protein [Candidatus Tanganyikabacteria bacterium]
MSLSVGSNAYYVPASYAAGGPVPTAPSPAPYAAPPSAAPAPASGTYGANGFLDVVKSIFSGIVNFFKGIWNKLVGGNKPAEPLDPDSAAIAQTYRLFPSKENVQAFLLEARRYEQDGTLGPGSPNSQAVQQVQQALAAWGFAVSVNGQYDQATANAVIQFKLRYGLHQSYRSADGNWAVNEYLDNQTLTKMREVLASGQRPPAQPVPQPTPQQPAPPPATGTVQWQAVAQRYGLEATEANVNAFLQEVGTYNSGGALGPGMAPERAADIKELQRLLATVFGHPEVQQTGTWDQATSLAVIDYKRKNGIKQNYKAADGNYAVNEYADLQTLRLMMQQAGIK